MIGLLIALNAAAFLVEQLAPERLIGLFALWPARSSSTPAFQVWQLLTYSFLHGNFMHLAVNMFGLYMFGRDVEAAIGRTHLALLYGTSVMSGALLQLLASLADATVRVPAIGASAGVFGLLIAYALLFPHRRVILLFPPVPMPAWLFATGYGVLELVLGISGAQSGVAHFAHVGGMLGAATLLLHWMHTPRERRTD
ncbi:rhomboid family intramembrane serine protease [Paraburkholderia sp. MM5384-R2]|uniref:rhomboid family intramembrane serine protease n=1 Tax=Paraburkholderia sp. MM5384-R2 TaxID=2723097 RepID=UPI001607DEC1|nr:rhomboid family intramembrane serine protease [Paraburkholderia sp. MM5384-R2]MBB5495980.1 membrane associated rhomboid family serine protease [Paraburkholderia sp. MM5384-R2]